MSITIENISINFHQTHCYDYSDHWNLPPLLLRNCTKLTLSRMNPLLKGFSQEPSVPFGELKLLTTIQDVLPIPHTKSRQNSEHQGAELSHHSGAISTAIPPLLPSGL